MLVHLHQTNKANGRMLQPTGVMGNQASNGQTPNQASIVQNRNSVSIFPCEKIQRSLPSPCQHRLIQTNFFLAEHIQSQSTFWYLVPQIVNFQVINIISSTTHNSCTVSSNVIVTIKKVLHKSFVFLIKLLLLFYPSLQQDIFFAAAAVSFHRTGNKICTY